MARILADHNIEGQLGVLLRVCLSEDWADFWLPLRCQIDTFDQLGLSHDTEDIEIWKLCQEFGIVLVTGNRNADGPTSLERAIRELGTTQSLPVLTISDSERLMIDRTYAEAAALKLLDYLTDLDNLRGTGRLYIP